MPLVPSGRPGPVVSASSQVDVTYTTLSSAAGKLFTGYKPIVTYEAGSHTIDLSNIIDKITIQGDTRGLAGLSYMHGSTVVSTATGAGVGTITLSSSGNDVTVACSTTNPDFSTLLAGDKLLICNTSKVIAEYEIASVSGNTITLTTSAPTINSKAACITIVPNRTISTALSIDHENRITFQGFKFTSVSTISGKAEFKNCVWDNIATNAILVNGGDVLFTNAENTIVRATDIGLNVLKGGKVDGKINVNKATTGIEISENSTGNLSYCRANNTTTCYSARKNSHVNFQYSCAFTSTNGFYTRHATVNCDHTVVDTLEVGYYASYYGGGQAYGYSASGISSVWNTSTGYWLY